MKLVFLFVVILGSTFSFSQVSTATLSTTKCAHIYSGLDINYNNTTFDVSTTRKRGITYHSRGYIEFDLSSIPSDAIVISATLTITKISGTYTVNPWVTKLIESSWGETTVKASNQPAISTSSSDWETSYTSSGNDFDIDVKSTVQRMVYGAVDNYGWCIQVQNEGVAYSSGTSFHSDEATSNQPELVVVYYKPITFSNVIVTHESATGESDGSISFSHTDLDEEGHTYTWYNSSGTQLQTGATSTIEDLSFGWYGLKIEGSDNGETHYHGFLVGTECEEVTITYDATPNYTQNVYVWDRTLGGIDYSNWNWSNMYYFRTDNKDHGTYWSDIKSYIEFNTWMDEDFKVNQADILFEGWTHIGNGSSNPAEFVEVTETWNEDVITWNSTPGDGGTAGASIPSTTSSTSDMTVDMISFWDDWKTDNNSNNGVVFQLEDFDDDLDTRHVYHSPNTTTTSLRPEWTFKLALFREETPYFCNPVYAGLERRLTGTTYKSQRESLYFYYDEEYAPSSANLTYSIFEYDDMLTPVMSGTTSTLSVGHGRNQYILDVSSLSTDKYIMVVTNDKDEKRYLRFETE